MRLHLQTLVSCRPARAREQVVTPRLLQRVAWPLLTFKPIDPARWAQQWEPGDYWVSMRAFGVVPLGRQKVGISYPPPQQPDEFLLRDDGRGTLIRRWDHLIRLTPGPAHTTSYEDRLAIEAGLLTLPVWVWAALFYRWRQHRWRHLARRDFR